jgi:mono/diheme cytochrome c family protein
MNRRTLNLSLMVAVFVSVGFNVANIGPKERRNFDYFPNMVRTARYNAFEENPNFSDGMTLRTPVPGTIPRGWEPPTDINPFEAKDRVAAERGGLIFKNFCEPCHGADARGRGPVVQHGFAPPPTLSRNQTQDKTDAQLFEVVTNGIRTMPGYGPQLSHEDRWRVILHVRSFRQPTPQ